MEDSWRPSESEAGDGLFAIVERLEDRIELRHLEKLLQVRTDSEELGSASLVLRRRERADESAETGRIHDADSRAIDQKVDLPLFEQADDGPPEHRLGIADHEIALHGHDRDTPILCRAQFHRALCAELLRRARRNPAKPFPDRGSRGARVQKSDPVRLHRGDFARSTPGTPSAVMRLETCSHCARQTLFPSGEIAKVSAAQSGSKPAKGRRDGAVSRPGRNSWTKIPRRPFSSTDAKAMALPSGIQRARPEICSIRRVVDPRRIENGRSVPSEIRTTLTALSSVSRANVKRAYRPSGETSGHSARPEKSIASSLPSDRTFQMPNFFGFPDA